MKIELMMVVIPILLREDFVAALTALVLSFTIYEIWRVV